MAIKKNRLMANEERDKKIEQMDIVELKRYLCMKHNQNPQKCFDCPGIAQCKAGQRAVVLLSEKARKEAEANGVQRTSGRKLEDIQKENRTRFEIALQQPDMVQWLMDSDNVSREAAKFRLNYWAVRNQDLAEKYDYESKLAALRRKPGNNGYSAKKKEEAMQKYLETKEQPDPIAFIMERYGQTKRQANKNWRNWKMRYGDKEAEAVKEEEVSVADFLNEISEEPEIIEEPQIEEARLVEEAPHAEPEAIEKEVNLYGELNAKFYELDKEKERVQKQIDSLADRLKWLDKAQEALVMTANLFNPNSLIGKELSAHEEHHAE